jgi:hypothetical protein
MLASRNITRKTLTPAEKAWATRRREGGKNAGRKSATKAWATRRAS